VHETEDENARSSEMGHADEGDASSRLGKYADRDEEGSFAVGVLDTVLVPVKE